MSGHPDKTFHGVVFPTEKTHTMNLVGIHKLDAVYPWIYTKPGYPGIFLLFFNYPDFLISLFHNWLKLGYPGLSLRIYAGILRIPTNTELFLVGISRDIPLQDSYTCIYSHTPIQSLYSVISRDIPAFTPSLDAVTCDGAVFSDGG